MLGDNSLSSTKNPLLNNLDHPHFGKITPEHVQPAMDEIEVLVDETLAKVEANQEKSWEKIVQPLEELDRIIGAFWGPVAHLTSVLTSDELRNVFESTQPRMVKLGLKISQSEKVFAALKEIRDSAAFAGFSSGRKRLIEKQIQSAKLSGIELTGEERSRFNQVSQELSEIATKFSNNVLDSIKSFSRTISEPTSVEGMPQDFLKQASLKWNNKNPEEKNKSTPEKGPWLISLDSPTFIAFMKYCPDRKLREAIYKEHITIASKGALNNHPNILKILELRQVKANILGFKTYAELSLSTKMVKSTAQVKELLEKLTAASKKYAQREQEELEKYAADLGLEGEFHPWDLAFYSEKFRESKFAFNDDDVKPYFPFEAVLKGLFSLVNKLFGITVEEKPGKHPIWHEDVRFYDVFSDGKRLASFYLDPFSRPENKRGGAWMNTCIDRGYHKGTLLKPTAYLICNSTPPMDGQPSLLTFREVETLFHEFGHGLQHMLTNVNESGVSGINGVEWDAVELPSQFMENWCYHSETLINMTSHFETGEKIPETLFKKLKKAKTYRAAYQMLRQLHFATIDLDLHDNFDLTKDIFKYNQNLATQILVNSILPEDRFLCSFQHIFAGGYAAGYYSYKWAEVLSADAFSAFEEAGLDNVSMRKVGKLFQETVLSLGGSQHPEEVFKKFRGRDPEPEHLLRHSGLI